MTQRPSHTRILVLVAWLLAALGFIVWQGSGSVWEEFGLETRAHEHFEEAQSLRAKGRLDRAHAAVDRALQKAPRTASYLTFRGYLELRRDRPGSAVETFRRALRHDASIVATFGLAEAFLETARPDSARSVLEGTLGALTTDGRLRHGEKPEHLERRAQLWAQTGRSERALRDLSVLLRVRPDDPDLLTEAIAHAEATEKWSRVLALSDRLSAVAATSRARRDAKEHRARALRALGRLEEAYASYAEVSSSENLEDRARLVLRLERFAEAVSLYTPLVERAPQNARYRRALAYALQRAGRPAEAEDQYRVLLASGAATPQSRVRYAHLLNEQRRYQQAWTVLRPLDRPADRPSVHRLQANTAFWAGNHEAAASLFRAWVETHPTDSTALYRLGQSRERAGDLDGALSTYHRVVEVSDSPSSALLSRIAQMSRQTSGPEPAVRWYERCLASAPGGEESARCRFGLARAHYEAGAPEESLDVLRPLAERDAAAPDHLRLAARAATAANRPGRAAHYLDRLSRHRALSPEEREWRAGQLRASGQLRAALEHYDALLRGVDSPPPSVLEATADLLLRVRDDPQAALRLYRTALSRARDVAETEVLASLHLKVARAAVKAGRDSTAGAAYEAVIRANPRRADTLGLPLELARTSLAAGRIDEAASWAERAARRDPAGATPSDSTAGVELAFDLARSYLAEGRPDEAHRWARRMPGYDTAERDTAGRGERTEVRLLKAQILRQQGHRARAKSLFRDLRTSPERPEALVGLARIAEADDRLLRAFRLFGRAIETGAPRPAHLWFSRGRVAYKRGDYRRARAAYGHAERIDDDLPGLAGARSALRRQTTRSLGVPVSTYQDNNALSFRRAGVSTAFWVASAAEVTASVSTQWIRQESAAFRGWGTTLAVDEFFPAPAYRLRGRLRLVGYGAADGRLGGRLAATRRLEDGSEVTGTVTRESLLEGQGVPDVRDLRGRHFNRITDVGALSPSFSRTGLRARIDARRPNGHRIRVEPGAARYDDGNSQLSLYSHYQVPLASRPDAWVALRPTLYVETFSENRAPYFTPQPGGSMGMTGHGVRRFSDWTLEVEVHPQLTWTPRDVGAGGHGLLQVRTQIGPMEVSGGLFGFYEAHRGEYLLWRATAGISYSLP